MSKRTLIIFSIFIIVAILGGIFIFFYQNYSNKLLQDYIAQITICGNITDETVCYDKDFCEGIYGPVSFDSSQLEFKRCQRIALKTFLANQKQQNLCEATGGEWYRNKLGNFCLCQKAGIDKKFDKINGCINK